MFRYRYQLLNSKTFPNGHLPIVDVFLETDVFKTFNGENFEYRTLQIMDMNIILKLKIITEYSRFISSVIVEICCIHSKRTKT